MQNQLKMKEFDHKIDWFYEGNVSKKLVEYLRNNNYTISKDNSDNIKAKGIDIIGEKDGITELIEVKGYPSEFYVNGTNKGNIKRTKPKQQAKHWFSEVLLSCIYNYGNYKGKYKSIQLAIAFPKKDRYFELLKGVSHFFIDNKIRIKIYFVDKNGKITIEKLNH
jgi:5S rRNA maturation endonuclease (ribonuclease M5)